MNLNTVVIAGRLTKDPEVKPLGNSENMVTNLSIAHNRRYPLFDKETGKPELDEKQEQKFGEETSFINVSAFNGVGKRAAERYKTGDSVIVEGRLKQDSWLNEKQERQYITRVVAESIHFVSSAKTHKEETAKA